MAPEQDFVTVVMPALDAEETIAESLRSVLAEGLAPRRVIVVDNMSSDSTASVAQDAGATVLSCGRPGTAAARNVGIAAAATEWVAFLDADDRWRPGHLVALQRAVSASRTDLACAGRAAWDGRKVLREDPAPTQSEFTPKRLLSNNSVATSATAVRRDVLVKLGGFDESIRHCEDADLWLRIQQSGGRLAAVDSSVLYRVRLEPESQQKLHDLFVNRVRLIERWTDGGSDMRRDCTRALALDLCRRSSAGGYLSAAIRWAFVARTPSAVPLVALAACPPAVLLAIRRTHNALRASRLDRSHRGIRS